MDTGKQCIEEIKAICDKYNFDLRIVQDIGLAPRIAPVEVENPVRAKVSEETPAVEAEKVDDSRA